MSKGFPENLRQVAEINLFTQVNFLQERKLKSRAITRAGSKRALDLRRKYLQEGGYQKSRERTKWHKKDACQSPATQKEGGRALVGNKANTHKTTH